MSDDVSEVGLKMGTKIEILDNHSLGQAPTVGGDGIKRPVSLVLESSSTTSDEADTQSELEHDLLVI